MAEGLDRPVTLRLEKVGLSDAARSITFQTGLNVIVASDVAARIGPQLEVVGVPAWRAVAVVAAAYGLCVSLGVEDTILMRECRDPETRPATDEFEYQWEPPMPLPENHGAI